MAERSRAVVRFSLCCFLLHLSNLGGNVLIAAQSPIIVNAHPGQDIELSCDVTSGMVSWSINNQIRYSLSELFSGTVRGYSSSGNNLIVKDIVMNDSRHGDLYRCWIQSTDDGTTFTVNNQYFIYIADSNGAVIIVIVVVIIVPILCCLVIMNILFCYCCKRREQNDQNNEKDKTARYSIIVLGILTCGTSVLLWWLYKECCGSKKKYNVKGHSAVPLSSTTTKSSKKNSRKDKNISSKSANAEMTEAVSIQGSPTEVTYADTTKVFNGGTHTGPAVHYDYARTGAVKIVGMPDVDDDSSQQPEPILESYAVTEIIPAKDKKKDKQAKTDTKNQQPLVYTVVDKSKKKGKKDSKPQKPEISYMDPTNLEFAEEPRNCTLSFDMDHTVQYTDLAEILMFLASSQKQSACSVNFTSLVY